MQYTKFIGKFIIIISALHLSGCKFFQKNKEPEVTVSSRTLVLETKEQIPAIEEEKEEGVLRIEIGSSSRMEEEKKEEVAEEAPLVLPPPTEAALPPDTTEETDLTARLKEKMLASHSGKDEALPDVKIYLSEMKYSEFIKYYENLGYHVTTAAVPAVEIIEPVLKERPELAGKIRLEDYQNITIHQVMVDDAGISAADKYIDPDSFEVVEKTFVTKINK